MRLSPDGTLDESASFIPPAVIFWHDNTITEEYVVAVTSPFAAAQKRILMALLGFGQIGKAFEWDGSRKAEVREPSASRLTQSRGAGTIRFSSCCDAFDLICWRTHAPA